MGPVDHIEDRLANRYAQVPRRPCAIATSSIIGIAIEGRKNLKSNFLERLRKSWDAARNSCSLARYDSKRQSRADPSKGSSRAAAHNAW
jgi:hypothetical protein